MTYTFVIYMLFKKEKKKKIIIIVPIRSSRTKISTFGTSAEKHFSATFRKCLLINVLSLYEKSIEKSIGLRIIYIKASSNSISLFCLTVDEC